MMQQQALLITMRRIKEGRLSRDEAARVLGVSVRTVHNYLKRLAVLGPDGLIDHRRGNFRKLTVEQEAQIVSLKVSRPHRSARWIRDWMELPISVETVRLVIVRHNLNKIVMMKTRNNGRLKAGNRGNSVFGAISGASSGGENGRWSETLTK